MSTKKNLASVDRPDRFVTKPGPVYHFRGRNVDLRAVDTATCEALANDPACMFIQWASEGQRPKHQLRPLPGGQPAEKTAALPPAKK